MAPPAIARRPRGYITRHRLSLESLLESESLDIERFHFRRAVLDLEQVAPLVDGGGAPPNVYNRWRVRLES